MKILGIESTCDETGVAVVVDGRGIITNIVASSANLQTKYGGVIPEIAAREQVKVITPLLSELEKKIDLGDLDAIAVAYGPGLIGSLLIGVEVAKTMAIVLNRPLIAVNHLLGHVFANWLFDDNRPEPNFPLVSLIVSGGHTDLLFIKNFNSYRWIGGTRDDAAGEAFDKVARVLGLGYPGGPEIERTAKNVKCPFRLETRSRRAMSNVKFSRAMISQNNYDFSFSGIKTQVANFVSNNKQSDTLTSQVAFEFQEAVCDVLATKTIVAAKHFGVKSIIVSGGVAANERLREKFNEVGDFDVFFPLKTLSVDNGAMIAAAAFFDQNFVEPLKLQANASLHF